MKSPRVDFKKVIEKISKKTKLEPKMLAVVFMLVFGIIALMISETSQKKEKPASVTVTSSVYDKEKYVTELENRLESMISSINGVGKCKVMITIEDSGEDIYLHNYNYEQSEKSDGGKSFEQKDSYVIVEGDGGEGGIVVKIAEPEIRGVAVVCEGAQKQSVKAQIIQTVTALLNISSVRVSVAEMG